MKKKTGIISYLFACSVIIAYAIYAGNNHANCNECKAGLKGSVIKK